MIAFHNDIKIKEKYVNRVKKHRELDNLKQCETGENGKGCAVACTLDMVYDHSRYPIELGIPEWLARLEDTIFEGLNVEDSMSWPQEFLEAIPLGVDLEQIKKPFLIFILKENIKYLDACEYDKENNPEVEKAVEGNKAAIIEIIRCHENNLDLTAAGSAARSARSAAGSAARSAAWSAWSARSAAWSAESAAWSAAWSAAGSAAKSAAESARSAAWSAKSARSAAYTKYAEKLLETIRGLDVTMKEKFS